MEMLHPPYAEVNIIISSNQQLQHMWTFNIWKFEYSGSRYYKSNMLLTPETGATLI